MSKQEIGETDTVDEDVSDDAAWVRSFLDGLDDKTRRQVVNHERLRLLRRFALTGGLCPPTDLGSLHPPEPDADLGGDPGPDIDAGDDGVSVVDSDQVGGVTVGEGRETDEE